MSAISLKSITGITSITTPAGVDNVFTVHTNDTTERFRIDQTGNQNIVGIVTVTKDLDVDGHTELDNVNIVGVTTITGDTGNARLDLHSTASGTGSQIKLHNDHGTAYFGQSGDTTGDIIVYNESNTNIRFFTNGNNERLRITSDGQILVGVDAARTMLSGYNPSLQVEGTANSDSSVSIVENISSVAGPSLWFGKTRGTSLGSNNAVQDDDELGTIVFNGADGTDIQTMGAYIRGTVDGSVSSNNVPSRLQFHTASGGTIYERLRITSAGRVLISTTDEGHGNADDLTIATAGGSLGHTGITIRSGTSSDGNIFFSDATSGGGETIGGIKYKHGGAGSNPETLNFIANGLTRATVGATYLYVDDGTNGRITLQPESTDVNQILSTTTAFGSYCNLKYQAAAHIFQYGGSENIRFTSSGKVGINTSLPQGKLDVRGGVYLTGHGSSGSTSGLVFSHPDTLSDYHHIYMSSSDQSLRLFSYGSQWRDTIAIDRTYGRISAGKHGIGTYNDNNEYFKIQSNDTSAVLSIIGSNDSHSTLALGDEDDFNRARIRADHTHDLLGFWTADNERLRLTDKGVLSSFLNTSGGQNTGNAYYHRPILEITHNAGTPPTQVKITTNISWSGDGTHAHSVRIAGYRYGGRDTVDLQICWHQYNSEFFYRVATSSGSYAPTITLAVESGKVVIHLSNPGCWPKFYVESLYHPYGSKEQAEGWSWSDNAISGDSGTPVNTVPYKWDAGGLSFNDDHNNNGQGDLKINDGNLIVASGHGISFGLTADNSSATTQSELFDDYEEGSFTAILRSNSSPSNTNYTYTTSSNFTSYYTRIGNICYVSIAMGNLHTSPDLRNHQLIRVEGLPYNAARRSGLSVVDGRGIYPRWNNDSQTTNAATFTPWIDGGDNKVYMQLFMHYTPYTAWATVHNSTSSSRIHIAGCYPVA